MLDAIRTRPKATEVQLQGSMLWSLLARNGDSETVASLGGIKTLLEAMTHPKATEMQHRGCILLGHLAPNGAGETAVSLGGTRQCWMR